MSLLPALRACSVFYPVLMISARKNEDLPLAASLYLRAIAYLLPYFPSRWLVEPWEARKCRLYMA